MSARFDGVADRYDAHMRGAGAPLRAATDELLRALLGSGQGRCLDVCCGTGGSVPVLRELGWDVVGVDVSGDQLRVARERVGGAADFVQGDAASLPFEADSFDAAVFVLAHTDVDDPAAVFPDVARVLRDGGKFVFIGTHPVLVGPHAQFVDERRRVIHPGYHEAGWYERGPGISPEGLRSRVGARHTPLAELVNGVLAARLQLDHLEELKAGGTPLLALVATKR